MYNLEGKFVKFQLVQEEDIEFIVKIRNNHKHKRNLGVSASNYEEQRKWLVEYKKREKNGEDFYFLIKDKKTDEKIGLVRVYDIQEDNSFEQGSLVLKEGYSSNYILEVLLLSYRFAFGTLGLEKGRLRVKLENKVGNKFHKNYGAILYKQDNELKYYHFGNEVLDNLEKILLIYGE